MKSVLLSSLFVFTVATLPSPAAAPHAGHLGVEASGNAFVDIVKEGYRWEKADGRGAWAKLTRADVDAHGWPKTDCHWVADFRPCAEWAGEIDDPEGHRLDRSGVYHGSFEGHATLAVSGGTVSIKNQSHDTTTNLTTFEMDMSKPGPGLGLVIIEFKDTRRLPKDALGTGIANFRLFRPGYTAKSREVFTREYLSCLKSAAFSTIRFMGVTDTNGNVQWGKDHTSIQHWNNRKLPEDASVDTMEPLNKKDGWPWEYTIQLCNEANMDLWINIPVSVDDDYIRELANLIKSTLKPQLHIYLEHSNEVWNFGFIQYAWNKVRAKEEVKEGNARYDFDHVNNEEIWGQRRHAQRVVDAVEIFASVFGKNEIHHRIRGVLAGVTPDPNGFFVCGRLQSMLEYLKATGGNPKNHIYAISIPLYYGVKAANGEAGNGNASIDQILDDMRANIEKSNQDRTAMVALAKRFELPGGFCAYESGPDIGGGRRTNITNRILAIRDPRQKDLYQLNLTKYFWNLGGNLAMQFTLAGPYSRYGAWGLTDDIANPDRNSLFKAARELIGSGQDTPKQK